MIKGVEHLTCKERQRELRQPGEEKAQGDLISVCKYLMGRNTEGTQIFSVMPTDRAGANGKQNKTHRIPFEQERCFYSGRAITGTGFPERLWSLRPWRYSEPDWTQP